MASLGWFRDLMMVAFALLLLVVTGLLLSGSSFALMPLSGYSSLLPLSLIIIATICMTWTLRHWTTISWRRALKALVISLSACWITALACIQGLTFREGVFLRTSKKASGRHRVRAALRMTWIETLLAMTLFTATGLLIAFRDPPVLLLIIIGLQGAVFLCGPIAALWNVRAQRVPAHEYRRRHEERLLRRQVRGRAPSFVTVGFAGALLLAVIAGAATAVFVAPRKLTPVRSAPAQVEASNGTGAASDRASAR
jgi:hypothetical protein